MLTLVQFLEELNQNKQTVVIPGKKSNGLRIVLDLACVAWAFGINRATAPLKSP